MVSKALPEAYLRKYYQQSLFQIQGDLSSGNGVLFPLRGYSTLRPLWTGHEICFSYTLISLP